MGGDDRLRAAVVTLWWLIGTTVLGSLQTLARVRRSVL